MKKALKITGITLGSLVALALVLIGAAAWMLSSSGQLTKMVNKYAPQHLNCEMALGEVKLTLFKTFPNIGVDIKDVTLVNPMAGSPSDTLAYIDNLVLVMDADKLRKEKEIVVRKCILEDAFVNLYSDSLGNTNFDIFNLNEDDTTSSFDYLLDIETIILKNATMLYSDDRNGLATRVVGVGLELKGKMKDKHVEADLRLASEVLSLQMQSLQLALKDWNLGFEGEVTDLNQMSGLLQIATPDISMSQGQSYLEHDTLDLHLPLQVNLKTLKAHLEPSRIYLNRSEINLSGDAELAANKDVVLDMNMGASELDAEEVLTYLPAKMQHRLSGIDCSGRMDITESTVKGVYNNSLMPVITAKITTDKANVNVTRLSHSFTEVDMDVALYLDLNKNAGSVTINSLKTCYNKSRLSAKGLVDDLFGDIGLKLRVNGDIPMADVKEFVPNRIKLGGRANFNLTTCFTYKQLMRTWDDYNLNRLSAKGKIMVKDFSFDMDTVHLVSPLLDARWVLPASAKQENDKGNHVALNANKISIGVEDEIHAELEGSSIELSADDFANSLEKMLIDASLDCGHFNVLYDTIAFHTDSSFITFVTLPEGNNTSGLKARVAIRGSKVVGNMGEEYALNAGLLKVDGSINQKRGKEGFMNRWNPGAAFMLDDAVAKIPGLDETIHIDNMDFLYNSDKLDFRRSTFRIGQSDLTLQGNVTGIKEWIDDHKNLMRGELQVESDVLNINEILDLTSGWGVAASSSTGSAVYTEADPFMVPEGVDFSFVLNTTKAYYGNFDLNHLNGGMTVKDGTLILQEIGFTNKAAEMKLTAMYQSPRRNNLFLAMDFHLLNVQINDLLHMIPYMDTLVPMLKTFDGEAEFHIGAETNLKANYEPKISTLRAAADIEGKNLSVKDQFTFTKITDMLDISTDGDYRVDSLDVQLTALKNEIDLLPSQIEIGKYKVIVDGRMALDKNGEYHLSVTESPFPTRFGLCVSGPLYKLDYKLEKPKYPTLYKPSKRSDTEEMYIELKKRIADHMKENVK